MEKVMEWARGMLGGMFVALLLEGSLISKGKLLYVVIGCIALVVVAEIFNANRKWKAKNAENMYPLFNLTQFQIWAKDWAESLGHVERVLLFRSTPRDPDQSAYYLTFEFNTRNPDGEIRRGNFANLYALLTHDNPMLNDEFRNKVYKNPDNHSDFLDNWRITTENIMGDRKPYILYSKPFIKRIFCEF